MVDKRGISPLIATVLIIGFVIAIASIIFFWGRGYIVETAEKEGELSRLKLLCNDLKFNVLSLENSVLELENNGEVEISRFKVRNNDEVVDLSEGPLKKLSIGKFSLVNVGLAGITNFDLIPLLRPVGRGSQFIPCSNKIKTIG